MKRHFLAVVLLACTAFGGSADGDALVAVLVDTSQATATSTNFLRSSVAAFIGGLSPTTDVLLATTGRRLQVRLAPTADRKKAIESANGITSDGGPTVLMDGLLEVDSRFIKKANRKATIVIITGDGSESSRGEPDAFNEWLRTLATRGIVAHAVVLKSGSNGLPEVVANAVVRSTGGRLETIGNPGLLKEKMDLLLAKITEL